jgi:hypothetical protein
MEEVAAKMTLSGVLENQEIVHDEHRQVDASQDEFEWVYRGLEVTLEDLVAIEVASTGKRTREPEEKEPVAPPRKRVNRIHRGGPVENFPGVSDVSISQPYWGIKPKIPACVIQEGVWACIQRGYNLFISGPSGSGKSAMVRTIAERLGSLPKYSGKSTIAVTATTSNTAYNVRGVPIEALFGLDVTCRGKTIEETLDLIAQKNLDGLLRVKKLRILLIDNCRSIFQLT